MQGSLTNTFLGILTVSEVHELIDIFKGKGKRDITPFLEKYLAESCDAEQILDRDKKIILFKTEAQEDPEEEDSLTQLRDDPSERKGVLFILDSFRRTKKYQAMLKSVEIIKLYEQVNAQPVRNLRALEENIGAKSKGILVNKKHF